uniref:Acyltransferase n=1 Tax=Timema genevievae TaxID=629358 RepID=A0A7R9K6S5_TIMGE|nr:unnamed protein product [Timema genevievae]
MAEGGIQDYLLKGMGAERRLPEDTVRAYRCKVDHDSMPHGRLEELEKIMREEVEPDQSVSMSMLGLGIQDERHKLRMPEPEHYSRTCPMLSFVQMLAAFSWLFLIVFAGPICWVLILYVTIFTRLYWLALLYLCWMWLDRKTPHHGGRRIEWVRKLKWWTYYRDYFPLQFVKTSDLDAGRNYLFCIIPHGVLCFGGFGCFATDAFNLSREFPGIQFISVTLNMNMFMPLVRDFLMALGFCSVSSESLNYLLDNPEGGNAPCLVVGGATESMYSQPGSYHVVIKRRKGFVKLALQNGASLVPVVVFGETELYHQVQRSWLRKFQEMFKKYTAAAPLVVNGRGLFQSSFGLIPRQRRLTVVCRDMPRTLRVLSTHKTKGAARLSERATERARLKYRTGSNFQARALKPLGNRYMWINNLKLLKNKFMSYTKDL